MKSDKLISQEIAALSAQMDGTRLQVRGWIRTSRSSKNVIFVELNDGSTSRTLQIVMMRDKEQWETLLPQLLTGASIEVRGTIVATPTAAQPFELLAEEAHIIGEAPTQDYPLQKKEHSMEFLRTITHLRFRTATYGAVMRLRNLLSSAVRHFFASRNFIEIHTPIISAQDTEGAGELFEIRAPHHDQQHHFFGSPAFLTVSGQLNAECAACGLGKVYTFGPVFRAEDSHTTRHLSEFWMVEPEMAWYNLNDNCQLAEELITTLATTLLKNGQEELQLLAQRTPNLVDKLEQLTKRPYQIVEYREAIARLKSTSATFEYAPRWGIDLQSEHEQWLTTHYSHGAPLLVINYPREIKPFYMRLNDDTTTVAAMDLILPEVGEIIGGSQREERYDYLARRIMENNMDAAAYEWYLELRKYGTVPHSGFGLGFDRLLLYMSGMQNVRDVAPFPRSPGQAQC